MSGRIAVGVSGSGSNLRALAAAASRGELGSEIALVFSDRELNGHPHLPGQCWKVLPWPVFGHVELVEGAASRVRHAGQHIVRIQVRRLPQDVAQSRRATRSGGRVQDLRSRGLDGQALGWWTKKERNDFTATANSVEVLDVRARHGRRFGLIEARMTSKDASWFVRRAAALWVRHLWDDVETPGGGEQSGATA